MQLTTVIVLSLLASLVNASPTLLQPREDIDAHSADSCPWCNDYDGHGWGWGSGSNYEACSNGLYSQADCCDVDIAGVIALSCSTGKSSISLMSSRVGYVINV